MAAEDGQDVPGEAALYRDGEAVFEGYVVAPDHGVSKRPCVLLAHDWSGLTAPTKHLAKRYASLGYTCFAVDVYGQGVRGDPVGDNQSLMAPLMEDRHLLRQRLLAGVSAARTHPRVDSTRLAVVGYCFGGLCALDLARVGTPNLKAAVSFHGALQAAQDEKPSPIDASVLLLHGWDDPIAPPEDVLAIAAELTTAGADWQLHAYGHAQHAFTFQDARFPERGIVYDHAADTRSWAAMRTHLAATLDSKPLGPVSAP
ncbi:MAG: dienelactone hydrolase family protein [Pseudomonadota bacterium]